MHQSALAIATKTPERIYYGVGLITRDEPEGPVVSQSIIAKGCNQEDAHRLAACLNACAGITTEVLQSGTINNFDLQVERMILTQQRDNLLAALEELERANDMRATLVTSEAYLAADHIEGMADALHDLDRARFAARAAIAKAKGAHQWETGGPGEGASNHLVSAQKLLDEPRYTHPTKGGSYEKLGVIRGAGSLKGLAGIAYRNEAGDLFVREPESFAARMQLIKADGGAQ